MEGVSNGIRAVGAGEDVEDRIARRLGETNQAFEISREQRQRLSESMGTLKQLMGETLKKLDQLLEKEGLLIGSSGDEAETQDGGRRTFMKQGFDGGSCSSMVKNLPTEEDKESAERIAEILARWKEEVGQNSGDTPPSPPQPPFPLPLKYEGGNETVILSSRSPNQNFGKQEMRFSDNYRPSPSPLPTPPSWPEIKSKGGGAMETDSDQGEPNGKQQMDEEVSMRDLESESEIEITNRLPPSSPPPPPKVEEKNVKKMNQEEAIEDFRRQMAISHVTTLPGELTAPLNEVTEGLNLGLHLGHLKYGLRNDNWAKSGVVGSPNLEQSIDLAVKVKEIVNPHKLNQLTDLSIKVDLIKSPEKLCPSKSKSTVNNSAYSNDHLSKSQFCIPVPSGSQSTNCNATSVFPHCRCIVPPLFNFPNSIEHTAAGDVEGLEVAKGCSLEALQTDTLYNTRVQTLTSQTGNSKPPVIFLPLHHNIDSIEELDHLDFEIHHINLEAKVLFYNDDEAKSKLTKPHQASVDSAKEIKWTRLPAFVREHVELVSPLVEVSAFYNTQLDVTTGKVNIHFISLATSASEIRGNLLEGGILVTMFHLASTADEYFTSELNVEIKEFKTNSPKVTIVFDVNNQNLLNESDLKYHEDPVNKSEVGLCILVKVGESVLVNCAEVKGRLTLTIELLTCDFQRGRIISFTHHPTRVYASNMGDYNYKNEGFLEVVAAQQSLKNPNWFRNARAITSFELLHYFFERVVPLKNSSMKKIAIKKQKELKNIFLCAPDIDSRYKDVDLYSTITSMLANDVRKILKLGDFGNAIFSGKNETTFHLVSSFYRLPEVILSLIYAHSVYMWSVGRCLFELNSRRIVFPGAKELISVGENDRSLTRADSVVSTMFKGHKYSTALMKHSHLVVRQIYGKQKANKDPHAEGEFGNLSWCNLDHREASELTCVRPHVQPDSQVSHVYLTTRLTDVRRYKLRVDEAIKMIFLAALESVEVGEQWDVLSADRGRVEDTLKRVYWIAWVLYAIFIHLEDKVKVWAAGIDRTRFSGLVGLQGYFGETVLISI